MEPMQIQKNKRHFPIFNSHLNLAHHYWERLLRPGDWAIDATCGNGNDTLKLAQILGEGGVIGIDIQQEAINKTEALLYCAHSSFVNLGSARQSQIVANAIRTNETIANSKASEAAETRESPVDFRSAKQVNESEPARRERFGEVAASPNSHNLSGRSITLRT